MATEFNDSSHYAIASSTTALRTGTSYYFRWSEIVTAALRSAGLLDSMVDGPTAPADLTVLWFDTSTDPGVLKRYNYAGSNWGPVSYDWFVGQMSLTALSSPTGTGNAIIVDEPDPFEDNHLYSITPTATCAGAATTIEVTGVGTYNVTYQDGSNLLANELTAGVTNTLLFSAGSFKVLVPAASAGAAAASAAEAALYDGPRLDDIPALLADTSLTYTVGQPGTVAVGDYVLTRKEGFSYEVAASGATDHYATTAGGVKLYLTGLGQVFDGSQYEVRRNVEILERASDPTFSPAGAPYYNFVNVMDGLPDSTTSVWRSVLIGQGVGSTMISGERVEAIGDGAMRFAGYVERNTAVGSLALQWIGHVPQGSDDLEDVYHDLWSPVRPDNAAWDVDGMETDNPGVRLTVAAPTFATATADTTQNVGIGRDALLHLIRGIANTAVGYQAHTHAYDNARYCTSIGSKALRNGLFAVGGTAVGYLAMPKLQSGANNTAVGRAAGRSAVKNCDESLFLGFESGYNHEAGNNAVYIGAYAGDGMTAGSHSDTFCLQSGVSRTPLLAGDFSSNNLVLNGQKADHKGTGLHVIGAGGSLSGATVNASASDFVIEAATGNAGLSIVTGNAAFGEIIFSDQDDNNPGGIFYDHSSDEMLLRAGGNYNIRVQPNALGFYGAAAVAQPTGVAVSAAGIHAALVSLGLITA